ncbi:FumA C-terminus/TtdB family hydratase beta subunit [bacterium]|nr:FumA C-terminus/TtdB family hydratase beta subunit [bacterium]
MSTSPKSVQIPLSAEAVLELHAGDSILLNGPVYTARDAGHKRMFDLLDAGQELPLPLQGQAIYYCGPAPTPPGRAMGSAGPTSSYRMDVFTPRLLGLGLKATIGKGNRSLAVREACKEHGAVYLVAVGGAGALLAQRIVAAEIVAWEDLGAEALRRLQVQQFPVIVAYDAHGGSVFPGDEPLG